MEIMIQTKHSMFSLGSKGYRKVTTHDWSEAQQTFELLMASQTGKLKNKADEMKKEVKELLRSARGPAPTWDEGNWDDSHPDSVTGLDNIEPDKDFDYWAANLKK